MVFSVLSEDLPDSLKLKILKKWISESGKSSAAKESSSKSTVDLERIVYSKIVDDRGLELIKKVKQLYPEIYPTVLTILHDLINKGVVNELDGYTLYVLFNKYLNIPVKPDIRIRFVKHGKEVDLKEYLEK